MSALHDKPSAKALAEINAGFAASDAETRISRALAQFPGEHVVSSSFGAQAAVMLHLLTRQRPDIRVVVVDTGYLFPETYQFIDDLCERLSINLHVVRPELSSAWLEARHGRMWEQGITGLDHYNHLTKVTPMRQALADLGVGTWFAGLRRNQSGGRASTAFVEVRNGRWKVHPIADWSDQEVDDYLKRHNLPYHPLREQGYVSIGDAHTTRRWQPGMRAEDTRFFGWKRECGLHTEA